MVYYLLLNQGKLILSVPTRVNIHPIYVSLRDGRCWMTSAAQWSVDLTSSRDFFLILHKYHYGCRKKCSYSHITSIK